MDAPWKKPVPNTISGKWSDFVLIQVSLKTYSCLSQSCITNLPVCISIAYRRTIRLQHRLSSHSVLKPWRHIAHSSILDESHDVVVHSTFWTNVWYLHLQEYWLCFNHSCSWLTVWKVRLEISAKGCDSQILLAMTCTYTSNRSYRKLVNSVTSCKV